MGIGGLRENGLRLGSYCFSNAIVILSPLVESVKWTNRVLPCTQYSTGLEVEVDPDENPVMVPPEVV